MKFQEYQCPKCEGIAEDLIDPTEITIIVCQDCNVIMHEILSATPGYTSDPFRSGKYTPKKK